jgi:hypothetical protein
MDESFTGSLASFGTNFDEDELSPLSQQAVQDQVLRTLMLQYGLLEDLEANPSFANLGRTTTLREMRHTGSLGDVNESMQATLLGSTLFEYSEMASPVRAADAWLNLSTTFEGSLGASHSSMSPLGNATTTEELNRLRAGIDQLLVDTSLLNSTIDSRDFADSFSSVRSTPRSRLNDTIGITRHVVDEEDFSEDFTSTQVNTQLLVGLGGASMTNTVMSQTADSTTFEESFPSLLQRLAGSGNDIDEGLARAVRQVLQMGAVLAGARLADDEIRALPKVRFDQADEQNCSICLESFRSGELLTQLPCRHFFHVDCVAVWFQQSTRCPLCRSGCHVTAADIAEGSASV